MARASGNALALNIFGSFFCRMRRRWALHTPLSVGSCANATDSRATAASGTSEAERRPKRHTQIILRAIVEVDVVASLEAQADRSPKAFQTSAGINSKLRIPVRHRPQ